MPKLRVGVIGCGLIGDRRAIEASRHPDSICAAVYDTFEAAANSVASKVGARVASSWADITRSPDIDAVCVATPNAFLAEIAAEALEDGKHVLIEKPMGRNAAEAISLQKVAVQSGRILKIGFNHRYHPAIAKLHEAITAGRLGRLINARCRYGHGARPGYDKEWRGNRELAGGGELTDQGVHVVDLFHWLAGRPVEVFGVIQTAVWPLNGLEDNGFAIIRFSNDLIATLHTSWTQWKNLFSLEVFGERGSAVVEGLGRSYGVESLSFAIRNPEGGAPNLERHEFPGQDDSWKDEWHDFMNAVMLGTPYLGTPAEGVVAMLTLQAIYRSAQTKTVALVETL